MATRDEIIGVAKSCFDPEIPVNIWDLGLIYDIELPDENSVKIQMTLTTQHCPAAKEIPEQLKKSLKDTLDLQNVEIVLVFEPAWTPERITEDGKKKLGIEA